MALTIRLTEEEELEFKRISEKYGYTTMAGMVKDIVLRRLESIDKKMQEMNVENANLQIAAGKATRVLRGIVMAEMDKQDAITRAKELLEL